MAEYQDQVRRVSMLLLMLFLFPTYPRPSYIYDQMIDQIMII